MGKGIAFVSSEGCIPDEEEPCWVQAKVHLVQHPVSPGGQPCAAREPLLYWLRVAVAAAAAGGSQFYNLA